MGLYNVSMSWLLWTMLQWSGGTDTYSGWWFDVFWVYTQQLNCWIMWYFSLEEEMATHSSIFGKSRGQRRLVDYSPWDMSEAWSGTSIFNFSRNLHTVFYLTIPVYIHNRYIQRFLSFSPHPQHHLLLLLFLTVAMPTSMRWSIRVLISDVEYLFMFLLAIWISFLEKEIYLSSLLIFNCIFCFFLLLNCLNLLYSLDVDILSDVWFENILSHSVDCLFVLWIVSFTVQKPVCLL